MKDLEIRYRRWGMSRSIHSHIPEHWRDLSSRQMAFVADLHLCGADADQVLAVLCGLHPDKVAMMDTYHRYVLRKELDWVMDLDSPHDGFVIDYLPGTSLYAPGGKLKGCSLQQFMTADTYFQLFTLHPNQERWLNLFVAALYLHRGEYFNVDECEVPSLRKKAVKVDVERNVESVACSALNVRFAVYLNFVLIRCWLSKAYPSLFPPSDDKEHGAKATKPTDWLAVFDAFIGDDVADMRKYQMMAATDAFRIMNRRIRNAQKR
ncbi:MAG: hypothetical protein IKX22_03190 [Prevotella sp.]|nr:hypothetical protein [Prevotella sp.]